MRDFLRLTAFILIIIGTAGLLVNEFAWEHSSNLTIVFGIVNLFGLLSLGFGIFGLR